MTMLQHGLVPSTGGYLIDRSLRFNSADSAYLNRTPASAGNRKTWTWSGWVKRGALGAYSTIFGFVSNDASQQQVLWFRNDDTLQFYIYTGAYTLNLITTQVFRDPSSWYHIVLAQDTTQATDTNRVKIYVNGTQVTAFSTASYPSQNLDGYINSTVAHGIGSFPPALGSYFNGYQADIHLIDGSALTPSSFGENDTDTGVWKPKAYTGSYGTNGFKLTFSDNSGTTSTTLGKDTSGNGNNWTPNNFSVTAGAGNDSLVDTPTPYGTDTGAGGEVRGNYATWNPLWTNVPGISNGNLDVTGPDNTAMATIGMSSGKWYFETTITNVGAISAVGMCATQPGATNYPGHLSDGYAYISSTGNKQNNNSTTSYGASYTTGDVIGVAFDADAGTLTFYKNGVSQGTAYSSIPSKTYYFAVYGRSSGGSNDLKANFGQRPFAYTAPSGFKALCTTNLPTPTIGATSSTRADDYFNTVLWTGDGSYPRTITGVGFQPDFVWTKSRSSAFSHISYDVVRGTGTTKSLSQNETSAEGANSTNANLTAFASDGFTVDSTTATNVLNKNLDTFVAWNWKANGAGSSNTAGSITSTVSANTTAGFSIATFTTPSSAASFTFGHGLGVAPAMVIVKRRSNTSSWGVWHQGLTSGTYYLLLDSTAAQTNDSAVFTATPTSTLVNMGTAWGATGAQTMVAYCFAPVAGYSAFGSYTGNGSDDGPFVFTGMRPAFVMIKRTDDVGEWVMKDTTRSPYNTDGNTLLANRSDAEYGSGNTSIDELSNGFKCRTTSASANASGGTYIYMAFAQNPFKYSLAR